MNVSHRGSVGMMHDTIPQEVRLHPRILEAGEQQVMHYIEGADGPFWMTPAQKLETKHDQHLGTAKSRAKQKTRAPTGTTPVWLQHHQAAIPQRGSCGSSRPKEYFHHTVEEQKVKEGVAWKAQRNAPDTMGAWLDWLDQKQEACAT
jgi:hypothetical protein